MSLAFVRGIHRSLVNSLAFVRGIHRSPMNSPHKGPVAWKCFHLMTSSWCYFHGWIMGCILPALRTEWGCVLSVFIPSSHPLQVLPFNWVYWEPVSTIQSGLGCNCLDNKVHGANMGPIWGRQDPGGPHVGPMNLAIWVVSLDNKGVE